MKKDAPNGIPEASLIPRMVLKREGMLLVGLTGGVASGKTTVAHLFEEEGAYVIDADQIAKELVQPHTTTWDELVRLFGKEILREDESIDRKKLAALVFSEPHQRSRLEEVLHPRIDKEIERRLEEIREKDPGAIIVIDAALLVETGAYRTLDKLIVVTSTEAQQIERLRKRTGATQEEARRIIASQMALNEKVRVADLVIENEGSLDETRRRVKEVIHALRSSARLRNVSGRR
jgi:dephospho-CoA kinase